MTPAKLHRLFLCTWPSLALLGLRQGSGRVRMDASGKAVVGEGNGLRRVQPLRGGMVELWRKETF